MTNENEVSKKKKDKDNRSKWIIFLLLLLLLLNIIILIIIFYHSSDEKTVVPIQMDQTTQTISNNDVSSSSGRSATIPGFTDVTVTEKNPYIPLANPAENDVNFIYMISQIIDTSEISFQSENDAALYITEHRKDYKLSYDNDSQTYQYYTPDGVLADIMHDYEIVNRENAYIVKDITSKNIFASKGIAPGQEISWDAYNAILDGENTYFFRISIFDNNIETPKIGTVIKTKLKKEI